MDTELAVDALQYFGIFKDFGNFWIILDHLIEFRSCLAGFFKRHFGIAGNQFGYAVAKSEVVAEYAGNVFDYGFGFQGSVCTYLRHGILAILIADILNNLRSTVFAEVDIKVRRAYAFRIEEAFEQEIIAQWVDIGYFGQVCHYAACAGAASRSYRNIHTFGIADKVAYHQKIAGVFGFDDNA